MSNNQNTLIQEQAQELLDEIDQVKENLVIALINHEFKKVQDHLEQLSKLTNRYAWLWREE